MKKSTLTATITFGIALLFASSVQALNTIHLSEMIYKAKSEMSLEKEVELRDWMLSPESFNGSSLDQAEQEMKVRSWMLDASWNSGKDRPASESNIALENWMVEPFVRDIKEIALEDWMLRSFKPEKRMFVPWNWAI